MRLCYLRDPKMENYRFEKDTHSLWLRGTSVTLEDVASPTFLGVRQSEFDTELTAKVKLERATEDGEREGNDVGYAEAGITIYMDECEHYDLYIAYEENAYRVNFRVRTGDAQCIVKSMPVDNPDKITLKLTSDAEQYYAGFENEDGGYISLGNPEKTGLDYITVDGFEMAQAATTWAPPTDDQPGLIGPHWAKGWIIENCTIHDSKCSGISLGKDAATGNGECTKYHRKPGYQYQMEDVFRALHIGWRRERIGSHIIRNNKIYDCGQNAVVGHLGCIFSQITGNEIYNIAVKHEFYGHEIAGIKLHAAIDVQICNNYIHDCTLGTWLDWQAQNVRVSSNIYAKNNRDFFIEVTHGPYLVDQNIFASAYNFDNAAQGGSYVHNLCAGFLNHYPVLNRSTPYHLPHSTEIKGCALVYGNDDRWYQNVFVGGDEEDKKYGMADYNGAPISLEEYISRVLARGEGDVELYEQEKQPAYINANVYLNGAQAFDREQQYCTDLGNSAFELYEKEDGLYLKIRLPEKMFQLDTQMITTQYLGMTRISEAAPEQSDGSGYELDTDFFGEKRTKKPVCGPFEKVHSGYNDIRIWQKR